MEPRIIKNDSEYRAALEAVEELAARDPSVDSKEADRLELLSLLVEQYEKQTFPLALPDAVGAIKFRMDQQGLTPRDLVPYLGTRARVSEILRGKRPLTLAMIRALHEGLGIPAEVLLQDETGTLPSGPVVDWHRFPLKEMVKRGWVEARLSDAKEHAEELLRSFLEPVGALAPFAALQRRTPNLRSGKQMDEYALYAWCVRVLTTAMKRNLTARFDANVVTAEFLREVACLSWSDRGPLLAIEFLARYGIVVVIEPHLPGTHVDGAALLIPGAQPVVGLTLRHDRIDNFWFTLLHELVHVQRHLGATDEVFLDDLEFGESSDPREREADVFARDALIPPSVRFKTTRAYAQQTTESVNALAAELRVHPAVVAGRIRHEVRNFRILGGLVGAGKVRELFGDVQWP